MTATEQSRTSPKTVLAITSLGVFIVFLDTTIVNVAFDTISRDFATSTSGLAWVLNAYSLVFAALLVPAGRLADQFGRKRLFTIGLIGFAVTSAACGLAPGTGVLIGARALQAVFAALVVPTSLALLLPEFPPERRSAAIGTWGAMGAVAAASGPTLGALLIEASSWRLVFLVNVPVCALAVWLGAGALREGRDPAASGIPDPLGVLLVIAAPGLAALAIIQGPGWGWGSARTIGALAGSAVLLVLFVLRTRGAAQPVVDLALFRVRSYAVANLGTLLFSLASLPRRSRMSFFCSRSGAGACCGRRWPSPPRRSSRLRWRPSAGGWPTASATASCWCQGRSSSPRGWPFTPPGSAPNRPISPSGCPRPFSPAPASG